MVYPNYPRDLEVVLDALKSRFGDRVEVYARDEIPRDLHWCTEDDSKYCPPILVLAHPNTVIMRASDRHQRPSQSISHYPYGDEYSRSGQQRRGNENVGISGYDPREKDMRGVFMARGPGTYEHMELRAF